MLQVLVKFIYISVI